MKAKLTETKFKSAIGRARQLFSKLAGFGAVILIYSSASAQNLCVSGRDANGGEIFKFSWDGGQTIFASGLYKPSDLAFDSAGNLFFVDYLIVGDGPSGEAAIYKITPNGTLTIFATRLSYPSELVADKADNLFVAHYDSGIIYKYKRNGLRGIFASGLYHPGGITFDSAGNLFVADNSIGNIYQGSIYAYKPNGSRATFAVLDPSDRPAGLAFDSMGNLLMADLGGNIYKYGPPAVLPTHPRTIFGSVPGSAQSLALDGAGNLLVVDAGGANGTGSVVPNGIYKFTQQATRSMFASGQALGKTFSHVTLQPMPVSPQ